MLQCTLGIANQPIGPSVLLLYQEMLFLVCQELMIWLEFNFIMFDSSHWDTLDSSKRSILDCRVVILCNLVYEFEQRTDRFNMILLEDLAPSKPENE